MINLSPDKLGRTMEVLLRPISRFMILNELNLQSAVEILKKTLVQSEEFSPDATDSYISLKTSVYRKDVRRLRDNAADNDIKRLPISAVAHVLTVWAQSKSFRDDQGKPRALPRTSDDATGPGFDTLIRASKVDLPAATVLAELLKQGLVAEDPDGTLHLLSDVYVPASGDEALSALEATLGDHMRIAIQNATTSGQQPKDFDRVLRYTNLSSDSVAKLEATARELASAYLNTLNEMAHGLQQADHDTQSTGRFVTGVYIAPDIKKHQS